MTRQPIGMYCGARYNAQMVHVMSARNILDSIAFWLFCDFAYFTAFGVNVQLEVFWPSFVIFNLEFNYFKLGTIHNNTLIL